MPCAVTALNPCILYFFVLVFFCIGTELALAYSSTACSGNDYNNCVTSFTTVGSSTLTITTPVRAHILLIAGGGSGGDNAGGGGGAGQLLFGAAISLTAGTYTVVVGSGGEAIPGYQCSGGNIGTTSSITFGGVALIAVGGGAGAGSQLTAISNGGSGGGVQQWNQDILLVVQPLKPVVLAKM